jgi:hypothetical protein
MTNERCQFCKFWKPMDDAIEDAKRSISIGEPVDMEDFAGQCRRYPPRLDHGWDSDRSDGGPESFDCWWVFPVTPGEMWCGEFKTVTENRDALTLSNTSKTTPDEDER